MKLYQKLASCLESSANIRALVNAHMPSGSGVDNGTSIDLEKSTTSKLVFHTSFHHMNERGFYDGWTDHTITVRPSLEFGLILKVSGSNRNDINSYLGDLFYECLTIDIDARVPVEHGT